MSKAPINLIEARRYLRVKTGKTAAAFGIRGFVGAKRDDGYHLGRSDIMSADGRGLWRWDPVKEKYVGDYSTRRPRDRAGLSEYASALDITLPVADWKSADGRAQPGLKTIVARQVELAKAGKLDVFEIIGPNANGDATDYRFPDFKPLVRRDPYKKDGHRKHIHDSFPRDITNPDQPGFADIVAMLEPIWGPRDSQEPAQPEPRPTLRSGDSGAAVEELQRRLNVHGTEIVVDGKFGPVTDAAVRAFQRDAGLKVDGIVGPITWDVLDEDPELPDEPPPDEPEPPEPAEPPPADDTAARLAAAEARVAELETVLGSFIANVELAVLRAKERRGG